jgi:alkanesulfonate monooxygenase SsuD/methylene tetrahydromethanopterin reductase-like flavin-dependent oxidoreductase (luciferase family)
LIKPWTFEFFHAPGSINEDAAPEVVSAHFDWYLNLWAHAEELGFEGIFFGEHHFGPGFAPSPNLLIANLAQRTTTLRLGVMGVVTQYYEPWRIVEEIAMLDHLSNGRVELGTASGIPQEMAQIGLSVEEASVRNVEALEIIDAALRQSVISHHGKFWSFDNLHVVPRPLQQPFPPVWVPVISVESAEKAARRGAKICTGFHGISRVKLIFDAYRAEAERSEFPMGPDQLALRRRVDIARDKNEGLEASRLAHESQSQTLKADPRLTTQEVPDQPGVTHNFSLSDDEFIGGDPKGVAEQIIEQCSAVGAGHFLSMMPWSTSHEAIETAYELFGREVIPALRNAAD